MKETVLEIVQSVLSEMSSDNVNSIDDTTESQRVALMLKDVFLEVIAHRDWSQHKQLISLNSSGDSEYPNYLRLPDSVKETYWIRYDRQKQGDDRPQWKTLTYLYPDEFIVRVNQNNASNANVVTVTDWDGTQLLIRNDTAPTYWTSFDDSFIVTDSYDSSVDTILKASKSQAYVMKEPAISLVDEYVVDLPSEAFSMLKVILKNRALENIAQRASRTLLMEEQRQRATMSRKNWKARGGVRYPDYGRRGSHYRHPTFNQDRD